MWKEIEELKQKINRLPKEANYFGTVDHIKSLVNKISDKVEKIQTRIVNLEQGK